MVSQHSLEAFREVSCSTQPDAREWARTHNPGACRFDNVQLRNVAQAGGSQVLDAKESEEWLASQARQFELIL